MESVGGGFQQATQQTKPQTLQDSPMELEHAIGLSGKIVRAIYLHPNATEFVYISGSCIVICDLNDAHQQSFLREHDDQVTCLTISKQREASCLRY